MNIFLKFFVLINVFLVCIVWDLNSNVISVSDKHEENLSAASTAKSTDKFSNIFLDSNYTTTFVIPKDQNVNDFKVEPKKVELIDNQHIMQQIDLKLSATVDRIKEYLSKKIKSREERIAKRLEECLLRSESKIEEMLENRIKEIDQKLGDLDIKRGKKYKVDDQIKDEVNKQLANLKSKRLKNFFTEMEKEKKRKRLLKRMIKGDF